MNKKTTNIINRIYKLVSIVLIVVALHLPPTFAAAEEDRADSLFSKPSAEQQPLVGEPVGHEGKAFFEMGSASSTFDGNPDLTKAPDLQMLNARSKKLPKEEEEELRPQFIRASISHNDGKKQTKEDLKKLPLRERLALEYGAPDQDPPILAKSKDTPKPMAAILEALQNNDNELAYQYARQYVRHIRNIQDRSLKVTRLQDLAMQREGMKTYIPDNESPQYDDIREIFEKDMAQAFPWKSEKIVLDEKAQNILNKAVAEEDKELSRKTRLALEQENFKVKTNVPKPLDEREQRAVIRKEMAGKVPLDPQGKVDVYLFFRGKTASSLPFLASFNEFARLVKDNPDINVVALTLDSGFESDLEDLTAALQPSFPIRFGNEMAKRLNIRNDGALVFVAKTTGEAMVEEGGRNAVFMEEIVKIMRGGKKI